MAERMSNGQSKLDVYEFGRQLVQTQDLDPVYVLLWHAKLEREMLRRYLLSYWCFYHVGTASWITEGDTGFWLRMREAAASSDYPRSSERRHFRAANAVKSVDYLYNRGLAALFDDLEQAGGSADAPKTAKNITAVVQQWVGFGPWIAFKVADMLERLAILPITFDLDTAMYEGSPTEAAQLLWRVEHPGEGRRSSEKNETAWAATRVIQEVGGTAPPRHERPISFQEAETILCKWKSYLGGHYELGEDIHSCRRGLLRFGKCQLAQRLIKAGKVGGLW